MAASASADLWSGTLSRLQVTSDFFPEVKEFMNGHEVADDENVICTANGWLEDQEQQFFSTAEWELWRPWTKCIAVAGEYVEKWYNMMCVSRS